MSGVEVLDEFPVAPADDGAGGGAPVEFIGAEGDEVGPLFLPERRGWS